MMIRSEPAAPLRGDAFQLAGIPTAVYFARELAKGILDRWGVAAEVADDVIQALSELVTNAIVHACPSVAGSAFPLLTGLGLIEVRLKLFAGFLAVEVWDPDRPPAGHDRSVPHVAAGLFDAESGRGLALVAALSSRWGVQPARAGKTVFALFDRPSL